MIKLILRINDEDLELYVHSDKDVVVTDDSYEITTTQNARWVINKKKIAWVTMEEIF